MNMGALRRFGGPAGKVGLFFPGLLALTPPSVPFRTGLGENPAYFWRAPETGGKFKKIVGCQVAEALANDAKSVAAGLIARRAQYYWRKAERPGFVYRGLEWGTPARPMVRLAGRLWANFGRAGTPALNPHRPWGPRFPHSSQNPSLSVPPACAPGPGGYIRPVIPRLQDRIGAA